MNKELLSVLSLSLLVSLAPSCCCKKETKSVPKKTVKKIDVLNCKVPEDSDDSDDLDDENENKSWAQADSNDEDVVTTF